MSSHYFIDTHTLLWHLTNNPSLGRAAERIFNDPNTRLFLPAIALAEALFILEKKAGLYALNEQQLLERIHQDERIEVIDLDEAILIKTLDCIAIPEMHDRQIVATALLAKEAGVDVAILTRDGLITASGLIQCVW